MPLSSDIKFQKALALAASASNQFEAEAAELAARRLMEAYGIDPTDIPDRSLYSRINFAGNDLLAKLREEWRIAHPLPVASAVEEIEKIEFSIYVDNSSAIPFNINGFSKHARKKYKRKRPDKYENVKVTPEILDQVHAMFEQGIVPVIVRRHFGLTRGQIAGIKGRYDIKMRASDVPYSQDTASFPSSAGDADDCGEG